MTNTLLPSKNAEQSVQVTYTEIKQIFGGIYPASEYSDLAEKIYEYWISKLNTIRKTKNESTKKKDLKYSPDDPLSRIQQKTAVIAYADSVYQEGAPTFDSLNHFLNTHFPAIGGIHILPPCEISEERFNDGGFSQISRDRVHEPYGTNEQFEKLMENYFSMTDFVLNHVDIDNKKFQAYLNGDDLAGECFFVFSESEYQKRLDQGDFEQIFRPRPFPLFTIFRREPDSTFTDTPHEKKLDILNYRLEKNGLSPLPREILDILYIFNKVENDQMLLAKDYHNIINFLSYLKGSTQLIPEDFFCESETQETQNIAYIFLPELNTPELFLKKILPEVNISPQKALHYADVYHQNDSEIFGEKIRALTTFSHVQVDLNLTTFEGLKLLIDDFSWYLKMDLNMLRLDAANFAFKKWGTSCFGLPETSKLLKILYLSMEIVSPRMVPNLEVNAPLSTILGQMADKKAPPPMMYDFHLASMMPVVFITEDATPLLKISRMIEKFNIPYNSIRFSLDESHDGKSVNGSGGADDLLTYEERNKLLEVVIQNNGHVKYKSTQKRKYPAKEFKKICHESGLDYDEAGSLLFKNFSHETKSFHLKNNLLSKTDIANALKKNPDALEKNSAFIFFTTKILEGKEPYELCISTRDALPELTEPSLEVKRYLAFKTLSFALMGRHVKSIYFNDLLGLTNDYERVKKTGELRNIKRTKSELTNINKILQDKTSTTSEIATNMNHTIALFDKDPSFHPRGNETMLHVNPGQKEIAITCNTYDKSRTIIIVNTSDKTFMVEIILADYHLDQEKDIFNCLTGEKILKAPLDKTISLYVGPFDRLYLKNEHVNIPENFPRS